MVDVTEWLAVPYADGHQLNDPAGTAPALTNRIGGIAGAEIPAHLEAVACLEITDLEWEVPVPAELGDDLTQQHAQVVFHSQEQVGALLGCELKWLARCAAHPPGSRHPPDPACSEAP